MTFVCHIYTPGTFTPRACINEANLFSLYAVTPNFELSGKEAVCKTSFVVEVVRESNQNALEAAMCRYLGYSRVVKCKHRLFIGGSQRVCCRLAAY
jgi:hypothetical protein